MEEQQLAVLRGKLNTLRYLDPVDAKSGVLVQKLLNDLVQATDSYRLLKLDNVRQAQDLNSLGKKVEVLSQETGRLASENNQLHAELISDAESYEQRSKEQYKQVKQLEGTVSDLSHWKQHASNMLRQAESEKQALTRRVQELLSLTERVAAGEVMPLDDESKVQMDGPPAPPSKPLPAPSIPPASVDMVQAATTRVAALAEKLTTKEKELTLVNEQLQEAQTALRRREEEVERLGKRGIGRVNVDVLALEQQVEASEATILSLNHQVDYLSEKVQQLEATGSSSRLEQQLEAVLQEKADLELQLASARKELAALRTEKAEPVSPRRPASPRKATASPRKGLSAKVSNSGSPHSGAYERARQAEAELQIALSERDAATLQEQAMSQHYEELKCVLDETTAEVEMLRHQVSEGESTQEAVAELSAELREASKQVQEVQLQLQLRGRMLEQAEHLRRSAEEQAQQLRQLLEDRDKNSGAASDEDSVAALQVQLSQQASRLQYQARAMEAAENDARAARAQLQELTEARAQITYSLRCSEEACTRLQQQVEVLTAQLAEERYVNEQLTDACNKMEMDVEQLRTAASAHEREKCLLEERLQQHSSASEQEQHLLSTQAREALQLKAVQQRYEELQEQLREALLKLADREAQLVSVKAEKSKAEKAVEKSKQEMLELRACFGTSEDTKSQLEAKLHLAESEKASVAVSLTTLEMENQRLKAEHNATLAELKCQRAELEREAQAVAEAAASSKAQSSKLAALKKQLALQEDEVSKLQGLLLQSQQDAKTACEREEAALMRCREFAERARRAETLCEDYEVDLSNVNSQQSQEQAALQARDETIRQLKHELEQRQAHLEQLTTLSLRSDTTIQEYMNKLKVLSSKVKEAEAKFAEQEAECRQQEDALQARTQELNNLKQVLSSLDMERDSLQQELDAKTEQTQQLTEELEACHASSDESARMLAASEGRVAAAQHRLEEQDALVAHMHAQLAALQAQLAAAEAELDGLRFEYRGVSEDMLALVKENQVVSSELVNLTREHGSSVKEVLELKAKVSHMETALQVKDSEMEDVRQAYEMLALEHRRVQHNLMVLEREMGSKDSQLVNAKLEMEQLQEMNQAVQAQASQQLADLHAYEAQLDALNRQLYQDQETTLEDSKEKERLMQEFHAMQQVRFTMERQREDLQRRLATLDSQSHILHAKLQEAVDERSAMQQRWDLERERVEELERVVSELRTNQFKAGVSMQSADSRTLHLQETKSMLEAKVRNLQQQADSFRHTSSSQDQELRHLRDEYQAFTNILQACNLAHSPSPSTSSPTHLTQFSSAASPFLNSTLHASALLNGTSHAVGAQLRAKLEALVQEHGKLQSRVNVLLSEKALLQSSVDQLQARLTAAKSAVGALQDSGSDSAELAGELAAREAAARQQVEQIMQRNMALQEEVNKMAQQLQQAQSLLATSQSLQRASRTGAAPDTVTPWSSSASSQRDSAAAVQQLQELSKQLEAERVLREDAERRQHEAERDFQELMESIEHSGLTASRGTPTAGK